jgi:hypothetical protein
VESIHLLQTEDAWTRATGYFVQNLLGDRNEVRLYYLDHLAEIIEISDERRKLQLVTMLADHYQQEAAKNSYNRDHYSKWLMRTIGKQGLLPSFCHLFTPIPYEIGFNQMLIRCLINNGQLTDAETYCEQQIAVNVYDEYDLPYLHFLAEIYEKSGSEAGKVRVATDLLRFTFSLDDYRYVSERLPAEDVQKLRSKILSRARKAAQNHNADAAAFCFGLLLHEQKYSKMIGYIGDETPYSVILKFFEPMILADKTGLLARLLAKSDRGLYSGTGEEVPEKSFPEMAAMLINKFGRDPLLAAIKEWEKHRWHGALNRFTRYLKDQLETMKGT